MGNWKVDPTAVGENRCVANCQHPGNQKEHLCDRTLCWWDTGEQRCDFLPTTSSSALRMAVCAEQDDPKKGGAFCEGIESPQIYFNVLLVNQTSMVEALRGFRITGRYQGLARHAALKALTLDADSKV